MKYAYVGYRQIDPYLNAYGDLCYNATLIGSQFFECIGPVKSLKVLADASLDSQSVNAHSSLRDRIELLAHGA
jgi:hypothetical protein